ncbi:MAG: triose-phosphate isomerase [Planctomycetota bacterium]
MKRPFISGNWKMNLDRDSISVLCKTINNAAPAVPDVDIAVFPPYPYLSYVVEKFRGTSVLVGGQDLHYEKKGAFTGKVSGPMLKDVGVTHVLIGHSERRHIFGETLADTRKKVEAALESRLIPVLCIGEKLSEREAGRTAEVVIEQLSEGLKSLSENDLATLIIAYEPVWAIGTGVTATPDQAGEAHQIVRQWFFGTYSEGYAGALRILYGGSVSPDNVDTLMAVKGVDGALVGGASLKAESFDRLVRFKH